MIEISYNVRPFIKPITQQVAVRVRWNRKKSETTFITGVYADPAKWDSDGLKAKKSMGHKTKRAKGWWVDLRVNARKFSELDRCCG